ncbi:hypothetical protein ANCCAN_11745 [Ancylostoma caninum]|uniref:Uncharacterized protein n=1 Tax=Ancylostoma caninum TaxID=29170 RepID=A0A368GF52_ANCCA|nr:hypothetical protein ANCCAN_11745 [Ancylostoma caninum]
MSRDLSPEDATSPRNQILFAYITGMKKVPQRLWEVILCSLRDCFQRRRMRIDIGNVTWCIELRISLLIADLEYERKEVKNTRECRLLKGVTGISCKKVMIELLLASALGYNLFHNSELFKMCFTCGLTVH